RTSGTPESGTVTSNRPRPRSSAANASCRNGRLTERASQKAPGTERTRIASDTATTVAGSGASRGSKASALAPANSAAAAKSSSTKVAARRLSIVVRRFAHLETEADPTHVHHAHGHVLRLQLVTQATDGDVERLGRAEPVLVPHVAHQCLPRDYAPDL